MELIEIVTKGPVPNIQDKIRIMLEQFLTKTANEGTPSLLQNMQNHPYKSILAAMALTGAGGAAYGGIRNLMSKPDPVTAARRKIEGTPTPGVVSGTLKGLGKGTMYGGLGMGGVLGLLKVYKMLQEKQKAGLPSIGTTASYEANYREAYKEDFDKRVNEMILYKINQAVNPTVQE